MIGDEIFYFLNHVAYKYVNTWYFHVLLLLQVLCLWIDSLNINGNKIAIALLELTLAKSKYSYAPLYHNPVKKKVEAMPDSLCQKEQNMHIKDFKKEDMAVVFPGNPSAFAAPQIFL